MIGIAIALLALGIAFGFYAEFYALRLPDGPLATGCSAVSSHCSQSYLDTICIIGYALCLFGWALPVGLMVVRFIRNRRAWFLPLISIGAIVIGSYILIAILGKGYAS